MRRPIKKMLDSELTDIFAACCYLQESIHENIDMQALIALVDDITDANPDNKDFADIASILQILQSSFGDLNRYIREIKLKGQNEKENNEKNRNEEDSQKESEEQPDI